MFDICIRIWSDDEILVYNNNKKMQYLANHYQRQDYNETEMKNWKRTFCSCTSCITYTNSKSRFINILWLLCYVKCALTMYIHMYSIHTRNYFGYIHILIQSAHSTPCWYFINTMEWNSIWIHWQLKELNWWTVNMNRTWRSRVNAELMQMINFNKTLQ